MFGRFNIFGRITSQTDNNSASQVAEPKAKPDDSLNRRFPGMKVLASCIRSLTAGLSSVGSAIKDFSWSAFLSFAGYERTSNYNRLLRHGDVKEVASSDLSTLLSQNFSSVTTKTFLSPDAKSLSDMGYMTDAESNPDNLLIPSHCVQILGTDARQLLLEQALYEPESRRTELKQLQFVHENRTKMDPISFDRIKLKVNGQFLDCSDSKSFTENFSIFKAALQQLNPELAVTDDHFLELISLCDRNKTTAGTPSGAHTAADHLPTFGQAASLIPTEINFYEIKLSPDRKSFDFHFDSGRSLLNSITFNGGAPDHLTPNFLYTKDGSCVSNNAASLPADFLILERQCKFTWRYTPINEATGGNMGFGSLDLVDSRQCFCPLERKHAAALDARTQPFVNEARSAFETTINDKEGVGSYSKETHTWSDNTQDKPAVSEAFYMDLKSGSDQKGVCFLQEKSEEKPSRLYQKEIRNDSLTEGEILQFEKEEESKMATACQHFVDFVGNKDQALAISSYATQHYSPQILIHELGKTDVLFLPPYGRGQTLGTVNYNFTFSKSEKGETVMAVRCKQETKTFQSASRLVELTESCLNLSYNITFHFDEGNSRPRLEVSHVTYDYSLEETKSPKLS